MAIISMLTHIPNDVFTTFRQDSDQLLHSYMTRININIMLNANMNAAAIVDIVVAAAYMLAIWYACSKLVNAAKPG